MKMTLTSTENKRFTARHEADPIFMLGGAPTAHEVLSERGFWASGCLKFDYFVLASTITGDGTLPPPPVLPV
jgi:hypothetical protein